MQQRLITSEIAFQCDAAACLEVHRSKARDFTRAAQEARDAGWQTKTIVPGRYTHRCPAHHA